MGKVDPQSIKAEQIRATNLHINRLKFEFEHLAPRKLEPFFFILSYVLIGIVIYSVDSYFKLDIELLYTLLGIYTASFSIIFMIQLLTKPIHKRIDILAKIIEKELQQNDV